MENSKINPFQFFCLIVLFELGSAIVLGVGIDAKQDAWITIILGSIAGVIMFYVYYYLYIQHPTLPLTGYLQVILGKYLGWIVGVLYIIYFLFISGRVLRDFGDLLLTAILPETPLFIINILMVAVSAYVLYLGIEVLARTGEFYLFILLLVGLSSNILIFFSNIIDLTNLLPILEGGWKNVFMTTFPKVFTFPFGEMIVFTMLLPYLNKQSSALKVGVISILVSGILISYTVGMNIAVLGADIAARSQFPLLTTVGKIRVMEFLERLDALAVVTLVMGMFFKISIFMYAGILGIKNLFKFAKHQELVIPIGIVILFCSITIAGNIAEHKKEGLEVIPLYLHLPFQVGIPLVLFIITLIRKKLSKSNC